MSGRHQAVGGTRYLLSAVALDRGDVDRAALHLAESLRQVRPFAEEDDLNLIYAAGPLHLWAEIAVRRERFAIAVALIGAQRAIYQASPIAQFPSDQTAAEETLDKARAGLDPESFDRAWDEGTAMRGIESLDYALDQLGSGAQPTR